MNTYTTDEHIALEILRKTGVNIVEAALVAKVALEAGRGKLKRAQQCIELGVRELQRQEKTVTFEKAVEAAITERLDRRSRTKSDFRYITKRFMKQCKGLAKRKIRSIHSTECLEYINASFTTPSQRAKARRILSGVFSTAVRHGWCTENPVRRVEVPRVKEQRISPLTMAEINGLLQTAREYENGNCFAAVGLMLYAGIRPHEVARLEWNDIDLQHKSICILPQHSKTGGARLVSIHPPLLRLLSSCTVQHGKICPKQWLKHWRCLRHKAGWHPKHPWQPDVLRHTFAGYHLLHFRNYSELQFEMGHRDSNLLRTRYVDMRTVENASDFWS